MHQSVCTNAVTLHAQMSSGGSAQPPSTVSPRGPEGDSVRGGALLVTWVAANSVGLRLELGFHIR